MFSFIGKSIEKSVIDFFSIFIPGLFVVILVVLILINLTIHLQQQELVIKQNPLPDFIAAAYPLLTDISQPDISAASAIVMDKNSHVFVYQKNTDLRLSPASTTKIMSSLIALSYFKPTDTLTVKQTIDTQGSGIGLYTGEHLTFENLLKAALIYSANDAAYTIAENYPGGTTAFVTAMNAKAKELHLWNTHFGDPDGLDDNEDYTQAPDLVRLAAIAMENQLFASIVNMQTATITSADGKNTYTFDNRNILLGYDGVNGIKTGYTDEAGEVLATSVVYKGHTFYIIVMRSQDRFADTKKLLTLLPSISYISLHSTN